MNFNVNMKINIFSCEQRVCESVCVGAWVYPIFPPLFSMPICLS